MTVRDRKELMKLIWEDHIGLEPQERRKSFIFSYMKELKDMKADALSRDPDALRELFASRRPDRYLQLMSALAAYRAGTVTEQEFSGILRKVSGNMKKYSGLSGREELESAARALGDKLLAGAVNDMFNNEGFHRVENKAAALDDPAADVVRLAPKYRRKKNTGYRDDIDLLYRFGLYAAEKSGENGAVNSGALPGADDRRYAAECERLYKLLKDSGNGSCLVPLLIDPATGAGVFIIGCDPLSSRSELPEDAGCCCICVMNIMEVEDGVYSGTVDMNMNVTFHGTVEEAFSRFSEEKSGGSFFAALRDCNAADCLGERELEGVVDSRFMPFFAEEKRYILEEKESRIIRAQSEKEKAAMQRELRKRINSRRLPSGGRR